MPFDGDRLLETIIENNPAAAKEARDEDHTTFWLVVAEQFHRRGIKSVRALERALQIIEEDTDLIVMAALGMREPVLRDRRETLSRLREVLSRPGPAKERPVLKIPQPYLFELGDVLVFPTRLGNCINPYDSKQFSSGWRQDGWGAMAVVDRGRAFDFLAWYTPLFAIDTYSEKPALEGLRRWALMRSGTCSPAHRKRLELEKIGCIAIDRAALEARFELLPGTAAAISDISLSNGMYWAAFAQSALENERTRTDLEAALARRLVNLAKLPGIENQSEITL